MPQVLERQTTDQRQLTPARPPVERRPQPERRSATRFVRWLGWLTALVVIAGAGWWGWSVATSDDVTPAMAGRSSDELIRATSGYGEIGTLVTPAVASVDIEGAVLPSIGMWDYVGSLGEKDHAWVATAEHLGYTVRGPWISADGLTWEHIDGTVVTVGIPSGAEATLADVEGAVLPSIGMWDYVRSLGEKDHAWVATAEHLGYTVDGLWITADGQIWEHIDGTTVDAANPTR